MDDAALKSGRSVAQEIELRLEGSFERGELLGDVLDFAFGKRSAALFLLLGLVINDVGRFAGKIASGTPAGGENWMSNAGAFEQVRQAVGEVLERFHPEGDRSPRALQPLPMPSQVAGGARPIGISLAHGALLAVQNPEGFGWIIGHDRARLIHDKLGDDVTARFRVDESTVMAVGGADTSGANA